MHDILLWQSVFQLGAGGLNILVLKKGIVVLPPPQGARLPPAT